MSTLENTAETLGEKFEAAEFEAWLDDREAREGFQVLEMAVDPATGEVFKD